MSKVNTSPRERGPVVYDKGRGGYVRRDGPGFWPQLTNWSPADCAADLAHNVISFRPVLPGGVAASTVTLAPQDFADADRFRARLLEAGPLSFTGDSLDLNGILASIIGRARKTGSLK